MVHKNKKVTAVWRVAVPLLLLLAAAGILLAANWPTVTLWFRPAVQTAEVAKPSEQPKKEPARTIPHPAWGEEYGRIYSDYQDIALPLIFNSSEENLDRGAAQYVYSAMPGELGTSLIGGHNYPTFGNIYYLKLGETFVIETNYGKFTYKVVDSRIDNENTAYVTDLLADKSAKRAILYTCWPLTATGSPPDRVFVTANLVAEEYKDK